MTDDHEKAPRRPPDAPERDAGAETIPRPTPGAGLVLWNERQMHAAARHTITNLQAQIAALRQERDEARAAQIAAEHRYMGLMEIKQGLAAALRAVRTNELADNCWCSASDNHPSEACVQARAALAHAEPR